MNLSWKSAESLIVGNGTRNKQRAALRWATNPVLAHAVKDLRRRNYSPDTIRGYIRTVQQFAQYFGRSPEQLGAEHVHRCQTYLLHEKKLARGSVENCVSALRSVQTHLEAA